MGSRQSAHQNSEAHISKGSGNTKGSTWRSNETSAKQRDMDFLANLAANGKLGDVNYETYQRESNAWDNLTDAERLLVLEKGKFTGMWGDSDLDFVDAVYARSKESFIQELNESILYNIKEGYNMEDENHFVIKFKGQAKPVHTEDYDFLYKTNSKGVEVPRSKLTKKEINDIEWIASNYSTSLTGYHAKNAVAHADMVKYMGYHEFKNGVEVASWNGKKLKDLYS